WEKQRGQMRIVGIREFMEKFPKEGKYNLKYGFIFSSQQEDDEVSENQNQKEENKEEKKSENETSEKQKERVEMIEEKSKIK
ncbi:11004_t:CDS:1, partial [Paraglomus occultum]